MSDIKNVINLSSLEQTAYFQNSTNESSYTVYL